MAENLNVTPGSGSVIGMDLVTDPTLGTALIGYGKIMDGRAGNTNTVQVTASSAMKVDGSWYNAPVTASIAGTVPVTQSTNPWLTNASIVGVPQVLASLVGNATMTAFQGTNPWLTNASIVGTPVVNASLLGAVQVQGSQAAGVTLGMGLNPVIMAGEDYAANPKIQIPKVDANGVQFANVSLSGGISGTVTANQGGAPWTVVASLANNATVTAFQGAAPWTANVSVQGTVPVSGFPAAFNVSLLAPATVTLAGNVSIGSISVASASSITAFQGGAPWLENVSIQGTVPVTQSGAWAVNVSLLAPATVTLAGNVSIGSISVASSPTVTALQGNAPWLVNVSLLGSATLTAFQGGAPWTMNASLPGTTVSLANNATITAFQGGAPWLVNASLANNATMTSFNVWAQQANASVQWTASTASGASLGLNTIGYSTLLVTFTGVSMTAGTVNFEAYDGAMWWPLPMQRVGGYTIDTSFALAPQSGTSQSWQGDISGWQQTRLRLNGNMTGTAAQAYFQMAANGAPNVIQETVGATLLGNVSLAAFGSGFNLGNVSLTGAVSLAPINVSLAGVTSVNVSLLAPATVTLSGAISVNAHNVSLAPVNVSIAGNVTLGPANVSLVGPVNLSPSTPGGWTAFQTSAMASTVTISAVAGKFGGYMVMNLNSTPAYLQVFDLTSNVTLGLTTPTAILPLPANSTAANGIAANLELTNGMKLSNGLKIGATQGATNASVVATGIVGTFWYV